MLVEVTWVPEASRSPASTSYFVYRAVDAAVGAGGRVGRNGGLQATNLVGFGPVAVEVFHETVHQFLFRGLDVNAHDVHQRSGARVFQDVLVGKHDGNRRQLRSELRIVDQLDRGGVEEVIPGIPRISPALGKQQALPDRRTREGLPHATLFHLVEDRVRVRYQILVSLRPLLQRQREHFLQLGS